MHLQSIFLSTRSALSGFPKPTLLPVIQGKCAFNKDRVPNYKPMRILKNRVSFSYLECCAYDISTFLYTDQEVKNPLSYLWMRQVV